MRRLEWDGGKAIHPSAAWSRRPINQYSRLSAGPRGPRTQWIRSGMDDGMVEMMRDDPEAGGRVIAVDRLPLSYEELKPYLDTGCTLHLEVGPGGRSLKRPILIPLGPGLSRGQFDVVNYLVSSLAGRLPGLIPWALASPAALKMATYLRRYRTSSPSTLFSYLHGVWQFCRWLGTSPDGLVAEALDDEGLPNPKGVKRLGQLLEEYLGELRARGRAPNTIMVSMNSIRTLLRVNGVELGPGSSSRRAGSSMRTGPRGPRSWPG
jgi:hypothetical protein